MCRSAPPRFFCVPTKVQSINVNPKQTFACTHTYITDHIHHGPFQVPRQTVQAGEQKARKCTKRRRRPWCIIGRQRRRGLQQPRSDVRQRTATAGRRFGLCGLVSETRWRWPREQLRRQRFGGGEYNNNHINKYEFIKQQLIVGQSQQRQGGRIHVQ